MAGHRHRGRDRADQRRPAAETARGRRLTTPALLWRGFGGWRSASRLGDTATVRDVMAFEQDVVTEVAERRAAYSDRDPIPRQAETSEATSSAVRHLFAVVERYPEVKSTGNVAALQAEITRLENLIADRRELYNDQVFRYNTRIAQVPANVFAGVFGWSPLPLFATDAAGRERPAAELGGT